MLSRKEAKRRRKYKMCIAKRSYKTLREAKIAGRGELRSYRCPLCYNWHNTSLPDMDELAENIGSIV